MPTETRTALSIQDFITKLRAAALTFDERAAQGNNFSRGKGYTCRDIANKLEHYGNFASERQRSYAEALIRWTSSEPFTPGQRPTEETVSRAEAYRARAAVEQAAIAHRQQPPAPSRPELTISGAALHRINALFAAARSHNLQRPKIVVRIGTQLITLRPSRAGIDPTIIYVYAGQQTLWIGTIQANGNFARRFQCRAEHIAALQAFGDDPLAIARAHGHATGNCCFCRRHLSDARSVAMGYGPICAEHFGLSWGSERAEQFVAIDPAAPNGDHAAVVTASTSANGLTVTGMTTFSPTTDRSVVHPLATPQGITVTPQGLRVVNAESLREHMARQASLRATVAPPMVPPATAAQQRARMRQRMEASFNARPAQVPNSLPPLYPPQPVQDGLQINSFDPRAQQNPSHSAAQEQAQQSVIDEDSYFM